QSDAPLLDALSHELKRLTLVSVPPEAWNTEALDDYLKFNIQVLSDTGKVIEQGRDLSSLAGKLEHLMDASVPVSSSGNTQITDLHDWDIPAIAEKIL